ncbi:MAG: hypothetical protein ACI3YE_00110 [Candidatus Avispirillum sp.]
MKIKFRSVLSVIMTIGILFLCSCNSVNRPDDSINVYSDEENNRFDTVYSLFQYFKTSFDEFWDNLRIEYTGEDTSYKIPVQASELNWCISAILYEIDELDENAPFSASAKEEIRTSFEDLADSASLVAVQTLEKSSFAMTFKSNLSDSVERVIKMLDNTYFEELPSKNLISIDVIKEKTDYTVYVYITLEDEQSDSTEEQDERISDSFDKVLASGYSENGDFYELGANEYEDYTGLNIEFGLVKNNQWIIEPTNDFVFEKGYARSLDALKIYYIGNGCFLQGLPRTTGGGGSYWKYIVYNAVSNLSYSTGDFSPYSIPVPGDNNDNKIIISWVRYEEKSDFVILDTSDMNTSTISINGFVSNFSNICEGLFAVCIGESNYPTVSFFTVNGQIDEKISSYKTDITNNCGSDGYLNIYFKDGICTFDIVNENNNIYVITINRDGEVIDYFKKY